MMPAVNLLPWRQWRWRRRNRLFLLQLAAAAAAALLLVGAAGWRLQGAIDGQANRNALLQERVAALDGRIAEAHWLRQRRDALLAQIDAMQSLAAQRTAIVRIFDALADTLPEGAHYQAVELKDDVLALTGTAESSAAVAALMHSLETSAVFGKTQLISIESAEDSAVAGIDTKVFHLTAVHLPMRNQGQSS